MPFTEKQQHAACAREAGSTKVMASMSKAKASEWCHAKKLDKPKGRKVSRSSSRSSRRNR